MELSKSLFFFMFVSLSMRFLLKSNNLYVSACYDTTGSGVRLTEKRDDACSFVTFEKAVSVARALIGVLEHAPIIETCTH